MAKHIVILNSSTETISTDAMMKNDIFHTGVEPGRSDAAFRQFFLFSYNYSRLSSCIDVGSKFI